MSQPTPALLFTQCLQNDFVKPIGRYEVVPNRLHVGYAEALRLMGENPAEGPVARLMRWALSVPDDVLRVIHIRDWHDAADPGQESHLARFGSHCIAGTPGAAFAFDDLPARDKNVALIDTLTLNDFSGTTLEKQLARHARHAGSRLRAGVVGVWTEAKVSFLCYELATRYPEMELAVCSALCASSSRQHHFEALDQLERILGVRVIDSLGEFIAWLGGAAEDAPLLGLADGHPRLVGNALRLSKTDAELVRYLFRDCKEVSLRLLDGGYSGNVVAAAQGTDLHGHEQVPHVVKIGPQALMGKERASFERVQAVLGNNAPAISDFADLADRGAIKYRYASMGGAFTSTLQKEVQKGMPLDEIERIFDTVFVEQLGRFYRAAREESADLLDHYGFSAKWAPSVRKNVESILGGPASGETLEIVPGVPGAVVPNVCRFYEETLARLPERPRDSFFQAWVHGDLNGQNVILDQHQNVWLIDFFHTRRAHVLLDLLKLENDLCYIWTPIPDEAALREALRLTDALVSVEDLGAPLPELTGLSPAFERTWAMLRMLRRHHPALVQSDRDPLQATVGLLRYAVHTLSFEECTSLQKRAALYAACRWAALVEKELRRSGQLRIDWLDGPGRVGLTLLPGRKDHGRDLGRDLAVLAEQRIRRVVCLVPVDELAHYGVPDLLDQYRAHGLAVHHSPVKDQAGSSVAEMREVVRFIEAGVEAGENVLLHCVGGLGRSGMAAACWLVAQGATPDDAIALVRKARTPRAVETAAQEELVRAYASLTR